MERRKFLGLTGKAIVASSMLSAPAALRAQRVTGPPVRIALVGYGVRGSRLLMHARRLTSVQIVAVADAYEGRLARAVELVGTDVVRSRDGRSVLDRDDVDAVLIATPDHLHAPLAAAAMRAGKDVYCEGPVAHTPADISSLASFVSADKQTVKHSSTQAREPHRAVLFQGGVGMASSPMMLAARTLIQEGRIGKVTMAVGTWDSGSAADAWVLSYPPDASPESIDFEAFAGQPVPFDTAQFFRWPCYWRYGSGLAGMRAASQLAAVHWLLDLETPSRVVAGGGTLRWKDSREVPDVLTTTLDYPTGVSVSLSMSQNGTGRPRELRLIGTDGTLVIGDTELVLMLEPQYEAYDRIGDTFAKPSRDWFYMIHGLTSEGGRRGSVPPEKRVERYVLPNGTGADGAHLSAFVDAVRMREATIEPLKGALDAARATQLVALASRGGEVVTPANLVAEAGSQ